MSKAGLCGAHGENGGIGPGAEAEAAAEWRETASLREGRHERQGAGPEPQDVGVGTSALP